ncbi:MAG TPA: YjgN family protein [Usitatibacter sp.]|nr:YjgN family protein [Usitatibacter sp.]
MAELPTEPEARVYPFSFTGSAREYFRIWVVNLFLTIVTAGIYSPWAKVRKKRYIYGNTWVSGANFEYHGNPVAILRGRIIAVLALVLYNVASHYLPRLGTAVVIALMVAAPWLVVRSMQFNAVSSSYRNLRFHFHGRYGEGFAVIAPLLLSPVLALVLPVVEPGHLPTTAWEIWGAVLPSLPVVIFYPYVIGMLKRFQVANSAYGTKGFAFLSTIRKFYWIYIKSFLILLPCAFLAGIATGVLVMMSAPPWIGAVFFYFTVVPLLLAYTRARVANLTFNSTTLGGDVRFVSTLAALKLASLYFTNLVAIVASCGLLVPWAVMRVADYRASCLRIESEHELDGFLAGVARPVSATGDQLGEFFDVDLSL